MCPACGQKQMAFLGWQNKTCQSCGKRYDVRKHAIHEQVGEKGESGWLTFRK
jgi:predicted RNA-binding Zn-ribbon protein involved in translation (DUF1610 family)